MIITKENIWKLAGEGNLEILKSPLVTSLKKGVEKRTPLHRMAMLNSNLGILEHPLVDKVKDINGRTPLHIYISWHRAFINNSINYIYFKKWLEKKYSWFKLEEGRKIGHDVINEILNTSNAERFIFESNL